MRIMQKLLIVIVGLFVATIAAATIWQVVIQRKMQEKDRQQTATMRNVLDSVAAELDIEGFVSQGMIGYRQKTDWKGVSNELYPEVSNYYNAQDVNPLDFQKKLASLGWSKTEIDEDDVYGKFWCLSNQAHQNRLVCVEKLKTMAYSDYIGGDSGDLRLPLPYFDNKRSIKPGFNVVLSVLDVPRF